jgi:hypothetical protein
MQLEGRSPAAVSTNNSDDCVSVSQIALALRVCVWGEILVQGGYRERNRHGVLRT